MRAVGVGIAVADDELLSHHHAEYVRFVSTTFLVEHHRRLRNLEFLALKARFDVDEGPPGAVFRVQDQVLARHTPGIKRCALRASNLDWPFLGGVPSEFAGTCNRSRR